MNSIPHQFVNNKEQFNNRVFERNNQSLHIKLENPLNPTYFNINYLNNRKVDTNIYNRENTNTPQKPAFGQIDFRAVNDKPKYK